MAAFTNQINKNKVERRALVAKTRDMTLNAEKENRSLTPDERTEVDKINAAIANHETRIADLEAMEVDEAPVTETPVTETRSGRSFETESSDPRGTKEYRSAYRQYLRTGEQRNMSLGTDASGGYLVTPLETSTDIIKLVNEKLFIRDLARVYSLQNSEAIGLPQVTANMSRASWGAEVPGSDQASDTALTLARRDLTPIQLTALVVVSNRLLKTSINIEQFINEQLVDSFALAQEEKFLVGTGSTQPLGVFVASANGIPTSRDFVSTVDNSFSAADLIDMRYRLKDSYANSKSCRWVMNQAVAKIIRSFVGSDGHPLWAENGLILGQPPTLMGIPVQLSEFAPATLTGGSYPIVLGDFSYYAIAEVSALEVQRLSETFRLKSQTGFIGQWWIDGSPVQAEAFIRLQTKTAA